MLIKLHVSNFLSFEKLTEIVMIPSNRVKGLKEHVITLHKASVLKYGVIYGANAAGKSNLIKIFSFIKRCVKSRSITFGMDKFCKNSKENKNKDSLFELQFSLNGRFYAYGFTLLLEQQDFVSEWLYELHYNEPPTTIFIWEKGKKPKIESKLMSEADVNRVKTYIEDFDENADTLFLHAMNNEKRYGKESSIYIFKEVYNWITQKIVVVTPDTALKSFEYYYDHASMSLINKLIKIFDTGITSVNMVETTLEALRKELPKPVFENVLNNVKIMRGQGSPRLVSFSMRANQCFISVTSDDRGNPKINTLSLKHGSDSYDFKYSEESDGTKRLFELLDMLLNVTEDVVYIVDEIERSLHPKLTEKFLVLFEQRHCMKNVQLLFTTHEATIMDLSLFRRDEIWFVERDKDNNSNVYSLDKFRERYDRKLSKAYLDGRYGAVPVFKKFSFQED